MLTTRFGISTLASDPKLRMKKAKLVLFCEFMPEKKPILHDYVQKSLFSLLESPLKHFHANFEVVTASSMLQLLCDQKFRNKNDLHVVILWIYARGESISLMAYFASISPAC